MELSKGNRIYSKQNESVMKNASVSPPQKTKHATSHQVQQKILAEGTSENRLEMERLTTNVRESDRCRTKVRTTQEGTRKGNMYRHSRKRICRYRTPLPPNFNVVKNVCLVVRTFVRKMPALMAVQNHATLKLGEGGKEKPSENKRCG